MRSRLCLALILAIAGCKKEVKSIFAPAGSKVKVFEERTRGAMLIPDMTRVFITSLGDAALTSQKVVFQAEDAGQICYEWKGIDQLQISLSGGYPDEITPLWTGDSGQEIHIHFRPDGNCRWPGD